MASRKKTFVPKKAAPTDAHCYAEFIGDLLSGAIVASDLLESRRGPNSKLDLEYDDPNG